MGPIQERFLDATRKDIFPQLLAENQRVSVRNPERNNTSVIGRIISIQYDGQRHPVRFSMSEDMGISDGVTIHVTIKH